MGVLQTIMVEISSQDVEAWPFKDLAETVVEMRRELDQLEVEWTRRVGVLANKMGTDPEGHSSVTALLKHRCRMSGSRAQRSVALANALPRVPFVGKALDAGDLSLDQARVFTRQPDHLIDDLTRDEVALVNAVGPLSVADTHRVLEYWRAAVDGPGVQATDEELANRRYLFAAKTFDGMVKVDGLLHPMAGELVMTALDASMAPPADEDDRTPRQRRADALTDMARSLLDSGVAAGSEKPHLLILTDIDGLQGKGGGVHETSNGHVLTPAQVRQTACDASINRVVFGPDSEPVDVGRTTRVVPPSMRRALIARDRHCRHPGCDRPARWCDAHHVWHWADGGPTALWNLQLLCRFHHTLQHQPAREPP